MIYSDRDIDIQWDGTNRQPQFRQKIGETQWWDVSWSANIIGTTSEHGGDDISASDNTLYYFSDSGTHNTDFNLNVIYGYDGIYWVGRESNEGYSSYKIEIFRRRSSRITSVITPYH